MTEGLPDLSGVACFECSSKHLVTLDVAETGRADSSRATVRVCGKCHAAWCVADEGQNSDLCSIGIGAVLHALQIVRDLNRGLPFRVNKVYLAPISLKEGP
jgi:hypothetical protein